jgi:hypothetical protein
MKAPKLLLGCGCLCLLIGAGLIGASFWMARKNFGPVPVGADMVKYTNTREGRTGNLSESYVDFSFQYPKTWEVKPDDSGVNYVSIEKKVDGKTWENLNVGYLTSSGNIIGDKLLFPQLIGQIQNQFASQFQGLTKVSEGNTKVAGYDGYEAVFQASVPDDSGLPVDVFIRAVLLPAPDQAKGVALLMMGTSLSDEVKAPQDLGTKGDLPQILETFRF